MTSDGLPGLAGDVGTRVRDYQLIAQRVRRAVVEPWRLRVTGTQGISPTGSRYDLFLATLPARSGNPRFRVLINGGTHGDEPGGTEAVVAFLENDPTSRWPDVEFSVLPCTNPWGFEHNRRHGPAKRDLNRAFQRATPQTPEVAAVKRGLRGRRFDMFLDCHEDIDTAGLYVFAPAALGRVIVDAVRPIGPVHEGELVDGEIPNNNGVVETDANRFRARRRSWKTWPLPFYIAMYHQLLKQRDELSGEDDALPLRGATIETPIFLTMAERVRLHHTALEAALTMLHRKGR